MKSGRKILSLFLVLCLLAGMLPLAAFAAEGPAPEEIPLVMDGSQVTLVETPEGSCGEGLEWTLKEGVLTVRGSGSMDDYDWKVREDSVEYVDAPWQAYREDILTVAVEEGVAYIGENAFADLPHLASVQVPDGVEVPESAFPEGLYGDPTDYALERNDDPIPTPPPGASGSENVRYSVLVLDVSGSMYGEPLDKQKAAAVKFCESLLGADGYNYVAVVSFGSRVETISGFSNDKAALESAINNMGTRGSTNTIGGLKEADSLLASVPSKYGRSVVLCSDGMPNVGDTSYDGPFSSGYSNAIYNKFLDMAQRYDIFTLGFFHNLSEYSKAQARELMSKIQTAGYYEVQDPADLEFTFGNIADDVVTPGHSGIILLTLGKDEWGVHVVDNNGKNIEGAHVVVDNDKTADTNANGLAKFNKSAWGKEYSLQVTKNGYMDWTNVGSNWTWKHGTYSTVVMVPTEGGKYMLKSCTYKGGQTVDILTRTKTVSLGNDLVLAPDLDAGNFSVSCEAIDAGAVSEYQLYQGEKQIAKSTDGSFALHIDKTGAPFTEGGGCFIRVVPKDGSTAVDTRINLQFKKEDINEKSEMSLSGGEGGGGFEFKVGDDVPFLGGSTIGIDLPDKLPVYLDIDGDTFKVGINLKKEWSDEEKNDKDKKDKTPWEKAKETFNDARNLNLGLEKNFSASQKKLWKSLKENGNKMKFLKEFDVDFLGYLEGGSSGYLKGHVMLQGTLKIADLSFTTWCVVVPVTAQIGLDLEGNAIGELGYDWSKAQWIGSLDASLTPKLNAFGGVGVGKVAGAGAYGSADLASKWRLIGTPWGLQSVDLTGELGFKAYVACFKYERAFAHNTWHLYTANSVRSLADSQYNDFSESLADGLYNAANYEMDDVSYLERESEWLGSSPELARAGAGAGTNLASLLNETYRNAQPALVSDGTNLYAAFLRGEDADNDGTVERVYTVVTKWNGTSWTEPKAVEADALMDDAPTLAVDASGNLWLAYTKTKAGTDLTQMTEYAKNQTLVVGKVDKATLAFTPAKEYAPAEGNYIRLNKVSAIGGKPVLVWSETPVTNDDSVLWAGSASLYRADYTTAWADKGTGLQVSHPVTQVAAGESGLAYVADMDGNNQTTEDLSLFVGSSADALAQNVQGKLSYGTLPGAGASAVFMWNGVDGTEESECLYYSSGSEVKSVPAPGITREYAVASDRVYYSAASTEGNGAAYLTTVMHNADGSWSQPVTLTGGDRYLENLSVAEAAGEDYVMGMNTQATIIDEKNVEDSKNLVWSHVQPTSNLVLEGADYNADGIAAGNPVAVTLFVRNAGDHTVTSVDVTGAVTETVACSIAPGEAQEISVSVNCPAALTEYTFTVTESGKEDYTPDDNTAKASIGYADAALTAEEERVGDSSRILFHLENKGVDTANGRIEVKDVGGKTVARKNLEAPLAAGDSVSGHIQVGGPGIYTVEFVPEYKDKDLYASNNSAVVRVGNVTYTLRLDPCGGKVSPDAVDVEIGKAVGKLPTPTSEDGKTFAGWYTQETGGTKVGEEYVPQADGTLYARWKSSSNKPSGGGGGGGGSVVPVDPTPGHPFKDVPTGIWYAEAVRYMYANGLMAGTSDTEFSPSMTTSRGMIVTILYRREKQPQVGAGKTFADVEESQWYAKAVQWAAENGIVNGYDNGNFGPNDPITREQTAAILYRYAQYKGQDVSSLADLSKFADAGAVSSYAETSLRWAHSIGLINGRSETELAPGGQTQRCEAAEMLMRFCKR